MRSLNSRLLLTASVALLIFFAISALLLDMAFRQTAESLLANRLQVAVTSLIAATELDNQGRVVVPQAAPESRLHRPGAGLYAQIRRADGAVVWRSRSMLGSRINYPPTLLTGDRRLTRISKDDGEPLFAMSYGVAWEGPDGELTPFTFDVAESLEPYRSQLSRFRRSLLGGFVILSIVLLGVQMLVIRWGLRPLRRMEADIASMRKGEVLTLGGNYPRELATLARTINDLLRSERAHLERYRNSLADLAHSLKTPLAVLSTLRENGQLDRASRDALDEQVERMNAIVEYQLRRASASGSAQSMNRASVAQEVGKITRSLGKVYHQRHLQISSELEDDLIFHGDSEDLLEIVGNLVDNACKWARSRVHIRAARRSSATTPRMEIAVSDDGPGMQPDEVDRLLHRGVRGDEGVAGHGIGLAVVRDIVVMYGGEIAVRRSELGGAEVTVSLPATSSGRTDS